VTVENRWCPAFGLLFGVDIKEVLITAFPFLEHLLSLQECNDIFRRCFTYIIYITEINVSFQVKTRLILSDTK